MDQSNTRSHGDILPPKQFPYCIVWTPIPLISWLLPFVGHMGVCSSKGIIMDFAGPYMINTGSLMFGSPAKYIQLDPGNATDSAPSSMAATAQDSGNDEWNAALHRACHVYQDRNYNFLTENCHAFVAYFMNELQYGGTKKWTMVRLAIMLFFRGRYASLWGFTKTWLPFVTIMVVGLYFGTWIFAAAWAGGILLPLTAWFLVHAWCINRQPGGKHAQSSA